MQAGDVKLGKVFANDHQSVIPLFQRPYVWDRDDNWEPLWKDVRKATEELEAEHGSDDAATSPPPTYFLGAVVVQQRRRPPKRLASSHIIDGQQRLTTLQVLIAAARTAAHELGAESVAGRFSSLLENRPETIHDEHPDDRYKVWPLPQDRDAFLWATRRPGDDAPSPEPEHRLSRARTWFEAEIREWAKTSAEPTQRLDDLHFSLQDRMQLVEITLDLGDDPQVIFEALNHRGVRLAAADLVKNLLFQTVDRQGDGRRAEDLLTRSWLPLDSKHWRTEVTTGRIKRVLVDLLLTYWLTVQTEQDILVEHLFADFKRWLLADDATMTAADVIEDIAHYAATYTALLELPDSDPSSRLPDHMHATNTTTPWPVLLYLYANDAVPSEQRDKAARAIESFLVRRGVCGLTTKDYNRLFVSVLASARTGSPELAGDRVVDALEGQTADSRKWPTDSDFIDALTSPDIYHRILRARLRALLVGIENGLRSDKPEPGPLLSSGDQRLNVEHLLPQTWTKNWALEPDAGPDLLSKRTEAVNRLGNLTLTTTKLNSALSNNPWDKKRPDIRRFSLMRLTTGSVLAPPPQLAGRDETEWSSQWDEERIELRTLYLAGLALRTWPRPEERDRADGEPLDEGSPREHPGRSPLGATDAVFVTAAGDRYHNAMGCQGLVGGQAGARAQDWKNEVIETVTLVEARRRGLTHCHFCQVRP